LLEKTARVLHAIERDGQTPALRTLILQHEIADVGYRIAKAERVPGDANAIMADIAIDLGDAMVQCQMLALDLGLVPEDVLALGLQHTWERFQDFWPGETP
jgi:hypothetical protein